MDVSKFIFRLALGRRLPITAGSLKVAGLQHTVSIRRDPYGIPCIEAADDQDAWYGLGFCHAQDRAFQLESILRVVRGTLAELVGPVALPVDRLSRRIGFYRAAQQQLTVLDEDIRQSLEAYTRGVHAGIETGCRRSAHEFALLRSRPTPIAPADVLAVVKLLSFTLASNWDTELARLQILRQDGPEAVAALDPAYPEWLPVASPPAALAGSAPDRLAEDLAIFTATVGTGGGSNNWAIAPARTAAQRPILANDPHLIPSLPSHWYLAHVRTPEWAVAGASFVGAPCIPIGHNGTAAWGITAGLLDNTDLFVEEIGPDGKSVRQGGQYIPCETVRETIRVKGGETVEEDVLITPRGPVVSPALEGELDALSLRAVWLDPRPLEGLLVLPRVRSWKEFRAAFAQWPAFPVNLAYADSSGTVGWQLAGEAPRRRKGWGTLPLAGWDPEAGWEDAPVPFAEMPHLADPDTGFVATANTRPTSGDDGPFLGADWLDGYRLARITEVLASRHDWTVPAVQDLQMDWQSLPWRELRDAVLSLSADSNELRQALTLLETWDGRLAAESSAATLFEFFISEMCRRVATAKAPSAAQWVLGKGSASLAPRTTFSVGRVGHLVRLVREQPSGWFDRPWPAEMAAALTAAIRTLQKRYGSAPARWTWGRVRPLTLCHPIGARPPLNRIFNLGPFPWGGDANTVNQSASDPVDPADNPFIIASLRMVVDVGNWDETRFALPGGQSGNPLSPHYADQLPLWRQGEGIPIAWSPEQVEQTTRETLHLESR